MGLLMRILKEGKFVLIAGVFLLVYFGVRYLAISSQNTEISDENYECQHRSCNYAFKVINYSDSVINGAVLVKAHKSGGIKTNVGVGELIQRYSVPAGGELYLSGVLETTEQAKYVVFIHPYH